MKKSASSDTQARLLIVDDDERNLKYLELLLVKEGYAVQTAASGEAAMAAVAEQPPDLVLLDIMMPGIDGFEVARQLKADSRTGPIPIILVTSLDDRESRLKGLEAGADEFLTKPVDRAELQMRVRNLLKIKAYNDLLADHNRLLKEQVEARTASSSAVTELAHDSTTDLLDSNLLGILNATPFPIAIVDLGDNNILFWSQSALSLFGHTAPTAAEWYEIAYPDTEYRTDVVNRWKPFLKKAQSSGQTVNTGEYRVTCRDGSVRICELYVSFIAHNMIVTFNDITERKQAESEIQRANRALATLGAVNHALVHATGEKTLLQAVCDAIVEQKGYRMAWVGYAQHDVGKSIKIMARAGHDEGYLVTRELTWAESERGMGPSGRAIRSNTTQLCQNIANDPQYLPWHDEAVQRGYAASIGLPLTGKDGKAFGTLAVYSDEVNTFSPAEVSLLEEMAGDLAFGVRSLHIRHERDLALVKNQEQLVQLVFQNEEKEKRAAELAIANKELVFQNEEKEKRAAELAIANEELAFQNEEKEKRAAELAIANKELAFQNEEKEKRAAELAIANKELVFQNEEKEKRAAELTIANKELQDSLEDTVQAIATIGEMRDPYTAGHQVRVADLATAIAKQLGLPDKQVHAIHLAGVVHDLGKIKIPAEILSKPGKITDIEFSLIKVHPQAGYDILKGIDFPWPIAQMVLQHHERLDGSGYPQGLKGDAILLEARILSVADVIEAMSSHRPYRPGLGIDVALAEITKQRGVFFDPQAVDACLAVFREQGFAFANV